MKLLLSLLVAFTAAPVAAQPLDAIETVRALYVPTVWNPLEVEGFSGVAEPALSILRKNEAMNDRGDAGCIDFVPTIDGQDYDGAEIGRSLKLNDTGAGKNGAREIAASFTLFEEPRTVLWTMVEEGGVWKVSDIASFGSKWRLSGFSCD